jgi:ribosome-associated protein
MSLRVTRSVTIPESEIDLRFTRSGGPGGQHANKTSTRVELTWNVAATSALGPRQRARVLHNLRTRLDSSGTLRLASDTHRSQLRNREEVLDRLQTLLRDALRVRKTRIATHPTEGAKQRRLEQKRRHSELKRARRKPIDE